jgi:hypothetical protein
MNLFELAERQILREGREPTEALILRYAVKIRRWLDKRKPITLNKILAGNRVRYRKLIAVN